MTPFLIYFLYLSTYIYSITFIQYIHPLPFAMVILQYVSLFVCGLSGIKLPRDALPRIELGPAFQQADADIVTQPYYRHLSPRLLFWGGGVSSLPFYCSIFRVLCWGEAFQQNICLERNIRFRFYSFRMYNPLIRFDAKQANKNWLHIRLYSFRMLTLSRNGKSRCWYHNGGFCNGCTTKRI